MNILYILLEVGKQAVKAIEGTYNPDSTSDVFKLVIIVISSIISGLIGLNMYWTKRYINENKKFNETLNGKFEIFADKMKTDIFGVKLDSKQLEKEIERIDKQNNVDRQNSTERINRHSNEIKKLLSNYAVLQNILERVETTIINVSNDIKHTGILSESIRSLQEQIKELKSKQ